MIDPYGHSAIEYISKRPDPPLLRLEGRRV
jgi:hypothetical protein